MVHFEISLTLLLCYRQILSSPCNNIDILVSFGIEAGDTVLQSPDENGYSEPVNFASDFPYYGEVRNSYAVSMHVL